MSVVKVEVQLSSEELLKAVEQLNLSELEQFVAQVIVLQAQRKATKLPQAEAELLLKINQGIPVNLHRDYQELIAKRDDEILSEDEYQKLLQLTEEIEKIQAQRLENLAELASLRGISLNTLMENLDIHATNHV
ncbi:STAS/SEC14 domain-containing protein [Nostoc sp. FACHB-87]|nr:MULTISPECIES: STAS/SEC14 domain-containing protein [Nostocaceae]MBD2453341.1 STAS/SEC14 domain-containing protein [Nostoc sp. FACHB-87]MBD2475465.1 STAS/SEC14 domain-containing protein [Anabaena sp. FACHB-83]